MWNAFLIALAGVLITGIVSVLDPLVRQRDDLGVTPWGKLLSALKLVGVLIAIGGLTWNHRSLLATDAAWSFLSDSLLAEPSGLVGLETTRIDGRPGSFGLAVDDEHAAVFLLREDRDRIPRAVGAFRLDVGDGPKPDDLEAIARVDERVYALTSHRRVGSGSKRHRRFLRFDLDPSLIALDRMTLETTSHARTPLAKEKGDRSKLLRVMGAVEGFTLSLSVRDWRAGSDGSESPYAFEMEALTGLRAEGDGRADLLAVGLKAPFLEGAVDAGKRAVLLVLRADRNNLDDSFFTQAFALDLEGRSISSLCFVRRYELLLVAANDPRKPAEKEAPDLHRHPYYASTAVYGYRWTDFEKAPQALTLPLGERGLRARFARDGAKLEGLAVVGDRLWLAYDGPKPGLGSVPVSRLPRDWRSSPSASGSY